jgi:hypothetical protein
MLTKIRSISPFIIAGLVLLLLSGLANAQNARGWDPKNKQVITPVEIKFDTVVNFDNFAAGKLPINFVLKNPASDQTITLASRLLLQGFRPSEDKSTITVYVTIDNLTTPVWDAAGCIETTTNASLATDNSVNITISYTACGGSIGAQNRPGAPLKGVDVKLGKSTARQGSAGEPIGGIIVKGGSNGGTQKQDGAPLKGVDVKLGKNPGGSLRITPGGSDVTENSAEYFKLKMNPSSNGIKRAANIIIVSSGKGAGSPKQAGF